MKIIKKGKTYRCSCPHCECEFEYTLKDVDEYSIVNCPECDEPINHSRENEV